MKTSELFDILKEKAASARPDLPAGFSALALLELTGPEADRWSLSAADGRLNLEAGAPAGQADITVTLAAETAAGLYQKTINPLGAFLTGKVKVKGDPAKIALIKQLLLK